MRANHVSSIEIPVYNVIASVYRLAIADAKRGDGEAVEFLDCCAPDWRERSNHFDRNINGKKVRHTAAA